MSPLCAKLYDWLGQQDGVMLLRDESSREIGEAITCVYGGAQYRIMVEHGPANSRIPDVREPRDNDW